ncbi:DNA polymerase subunit gamma-2 isoform X6 [Apteryx mantelli]|uniref:DNA polymerase subunit gamma-2 isoform X6 n=1 Tax=Apteryx mantelli TaxID=2696672 RepID=A0ABM4FHL2_9AVES
MEISTALLLHQAAGWKLQQRYRGPGLPHPVTAAERAVVNMRFHLCGFDASWLESPEAAPRRSAFALPLDAGLCTPRLRGLTDRPNPPPSGQLAAAGSRPGAPSPLPGRLAPSEPGWAGEREAAVRGPRETPAPRGNRAPPPLGGPAAAHARSAPHRSCARSRGARGACAVLAAPLPPRRVREGRKMALGCGQGARLCGRARLGRPALKRRAPAAGSLARPYAAGGGEAASGEALLEVCRRRHFLRGGAEPRPWRAYLSGCPPGFGPLGVALRGNLAAQWWEAVAAFREQVFAADAPLHGPAGPGAPLAGDDLRLVPSETLREALRGGGREPGGPSAEEVLGAAGLLRESLLPGALAQYVNCLELVNKRLPCGLAQIGVCFHSIPESEQYNENLSRS